MTNSALATDDKPSIKKAMSNYLKRLDSILQDNFKLKQEIANEKKRYLDLMSAFLEIREN